MAFRDRVRELSTSEGITDFTLDGAYSNVYQSFSIYGTDSFDYTIVDSVNGDWEVGGGTYSGGVLSRVTVYESSNNNNKVNFGSGIKDVYSVVSANTLQSYPQSKYTNLGDITATLDIDLNNHGDGDSIEFNAPNTITDVNLNLVNTPPIDRGIDLKFWATADADGNGDVANLNFTQTISWGGDIPPTLSADNRRRFSLSIVNDNGTMKIEGDNGALFTNLADANAIAFNPSISAQDGNGDNFDSYSFENRKITFHAQNYTSYKHYMSRMTGIIDQNSPDMQLTIRHDTALPFAISFGIVDFSAALIGTATGSAAYSGGYIGNFAEGAAWEYTSTTQSGFTISDIRSGGVVETDVSVITLVTGQTVTMLLKPSNGHGWFLRDGVIISGDPQDPNNDVNPHFTVDPTVTRGFAVSAANAHADTAITVLNKLESESTVNAYPNFLYAQNGS